MQQVAKIAEFPERSGIERRTKRNQINVEGCQPKPPSVFAPGKLQGIANDTPKTLQISSPPPTDVDLLESIPLGHREYRLPRG
jgi:hypothetical protein